MPVLLVAAAMVLTRASELFACSVCQGDPNSKLVQGAEAGVLFMVVVTYGLLLSMVGLGATWFVRQRRRLTRVNKGAAMESTDESTNQDVER
ncbi:MAG TPA: hypothetical protein P5081_21935 [Phycisphaerae bacterium]|nr:hypothetical protein [Phycisphaerae bacterium]HRW55542.1 hypothetical protein [Phycisphaerae bacterium]